MGSIQARILLQHFGSAEQIFKSTIHDLENIEGIGRIRAHSIKSFRNFSIAEKEMDLETKIYVGSNPKM